jgi:hypothetical protein
MSHHVLLYSTAANQRSFYPPSCLLNITEAKTPDNILAIVAGKSNILTVVENVAAIHRLAKLRISPNARQDPRVHELSMVILTQLQKQPHDFQARHLSNLIWAIATLPLDQSTKNPIIDTIASLSLAHIDEFNAQNLANTAWAFARLGRQHNLLFTRIAEQSLAKLDTFSTQNLSNLLWAFAKLNFRSHKLFVAMKAACSNQLHNFRPQELSNILWALATLEVPCSQLAWAIVDRSLLVTDFKPQELASLAWACAKLRLRSQSLFRSMIKHVLANSTQFGSREIANIAWAFVTLELKCKPLLDTIKKRVLTNVRTFSTPDLCQLMWTFVAASTTPRPMFEVMTKTLTPHVSSLAHDQYCLVLWAAARSNWKFPVFVSVCATDFSNRCQSLTSSQLSNTMWSFSRYRRKDMLTQGAALLPYHMENFSPSDLNQLAVAFSGIRHKEVFWTIADASMSHLEKFTRREFISFLWQCSQSKVEVPYLFDKAMPVALRFLPTMRVSGVCKMLLVFSRTKVDCDKLFEEAMMYMERRHTKFTHIACASFVVVMRLVGQDHHMIRTLELLGNRIRRSAKKFRIGLLLSLMKRIFPWRTQPQVVNVWTTLSAEASLRSHKMPSRHLRTFERMRRKEVVLL